jgi:DNA-binding transcriptional MerR regulator
MDVLLTIGDFSRMTYLGVKALRHYHEIGLLEPAAVDPATGYRLYRPSQVPTAQVIRRLRELGMPLEEVRAMLRAPDVAARNAVIAAHLGRMERQLEQTQATVASLRSMLEYRAQPIVVEYRTTQAARALAIRDRISMADAEQWWCSAFDELREALAASGARRAGPDGALYTSEFFQADAGEVTAFLPVAGTPRPAGLAVPFEMAATELAVTVHHGPFSNLDTTYGALGTFVAQRAIGVDGPIRENYLVSASDTDNEASHRTEACWPVFLTTTRSSS